MARRLTALTGFGALAASLLLLAGCASMPQGSTGDDVDDDRDDVAEFEVDAAWLDDGRVIGIVTEGSSTCVPTAEEPTYENGLLAVTLFDADPEAPCTRDLVPRVTLVSVPEGVDPTQPLQITVAYNDANGDTDLDGVAGLGQAAAEEGTPSAGWAGDDTLILVTYGSGSRACYPIAESVAVAGGVVTVTMAEPAADQVCTMDFVPQGTVIHVEDGDDAAELVLTGYGFDDVRVPILGTD